MGYVIGVDGIKFPATQVPSSDANTLDDYEEGSWTPVDLSGASLAFAGPLGTFEKTGRQVTARGWLTYPTTADAFGARIGGLPFTVANASDNQQGFVSYTDETTLARCFAIKNTTNVDLVTSAGVNVANSAMSTNFVSFTVIYCV